MTDLAPLRTAHDAVLVADGIFSRNRSALFGLTSGPWYAGATAWRGTVDGPVDTWPPAPSVNGPWPATRSSSKRPCGRPAPQDRAGQYGIAGWAVTWLQQVGSTDPQQQLRLVLRYLDGVLLHQIAMPDPHFDPLPGIQLLLRRLIEPPTGQPGRSARSGPASQTG